MSDKILVKRLTDRQKWVLDNIELLALRKTPFYHQPLWCIGTKVVADALKALVQRRLIKFDRASNTWSVVSRPVAIAALDDSLYAMI